MVSYPIQVTQRNPTWGLEAGSKVGFTDAEGRTEKIEYAVPPKFIRRPADAATLRTLFFYLPRVHSEGMYEIGFLLDPSDPGWAYVERDRVMVPPAKIEATTGSSHDEVVEHRAHGSVYISHTGSYMYTEILADGTDRRRVPLTDMAYGSPVRGAPMLEVVARAAPLGGWRGHSLEIVITLVDPPDLPEGLVELLGRLRKRLDNLAAAPGTAYVAEGFAYALDPLLGATRGELLRVLGEPFSCGRAARDLPDNPRQRGPCRPEAGYVYRFYRLPRGSLGGGPELRLSFDDKGRCSIAEWVFTQ